MRALFEYMDDDGSGRVEFGEFCTLLSATTATRETPRETREEAGDIR